MSRGTLVRLPRARRSEDLIVEPLGDELLIYDNAANKAHRLNKSAALIWRHCNGRTSTEKVLKVLAEAGLPADPGVVELAIAELTKAKLVEPEVDWSQVRFRSRRTLLKQLGFMTAAALALPIVQSIVAPSVAHAASCGAFNNLCGAGLPACCAGLTCRPVGGNSRCRP
jgi:hypothetical protein